VTPLKKNSPQRTPDHVPEGIMGSNPPRSSGPHGRQLIETDGERLHPAPQVNPRNLEGTGTPGTREPICLQGMYQDETLIPGHDLSQRQGRSRGIIRMPGHRMDITPSLRVGDPILAHECVHHDRY
jgi:hypothetical protein